MGTNGCWQPWKNMCAEEEGDVKEFKRLKKRMILKSRQIHFNSFQFFFRKSGNDKLEKYRQELIWAILEKQIL